MSRAIDELVAEKVMRWKAEITNNIHIDGGRPFTNYVDYKGRGVCRPEEWEPSRNIAAAWRVAERLRSMGRIIKIESLIMEIEEAATAGLDVEIGQWEVRIAAFECSRCGRCHESWCQGRCTRSAGTLCESICLAALRALNVELPKENA